ncbi:hypothetical protein Y032_0186g1062 [Ancylostoma ceylanicum]|uniref:EndoU domain-containing protein n=1 Tax=Ancylostoma ceylanicum TaxID=53326 RepID=A0A016SQX4_9BILA|nr:hypothetical protein Y032_0186g1062 [Ancylostoma ceylanicum]
MVSEITEPAPSLLWVTTYAYYYFLLGNALQCHSKVNRGRQPAQLGAIHLQAPNSSHFDLFENGASVAFVPVEVPQWDCYDEKVEDMFLPSTYGTRWSPAFKMAPDVDQTQVTTALNQLVQLDSRLDSDTVINYQNMASHKDFSHDNAPKPLFTSANENAMNGPTYKAMSNLITFYNNPDADTAEAMTPAWETSISAFLDTVVQTPVMKSAQSFLVGQGLASSDATTFKNQLHSLWFTMYARSTAAGSSGFEALFGGEVQNNNVIRFGNWLRFYQQEKGGQLNYHGWFEREVGVALSLQFSWNNWQALEFSMLLNSSPEFEMAAYTVCALTGGECKLTIKGQQVTIIAKTLTVNNVVTIDDCHPSLSSSGAVTQKPQSGTTKPSKPSDAKLQDLVNKMRAADVDKAGPGDYKLDWGSKETGTSDNSKNDLFVYVNETLYQRPVYANFITVVQKNLFTPDVCKAEASMSGFRKSQIQLMLDTWTSTQVFNLAFQFLKDNGNKHATDLDTFKTFLFNLWFGTYSRCNGPDGSSGFEHVFIGEWKSGTVDGQHSWVTYYNFQKADKINYHGYYSYVADLTGTFQYVWANQMKKKGGFLIGTSPAFDFSLFTVCSLMYSGNEGCRYSIDGHPLAVTSYTQSCDAGTCLSTSYPVD